MVIALKDPLRFRPFKTNIIAFISINPVCFNAFHRYTFTNPTGITHLRDTMRLH